VTVTHRIEPLDPSADLDAIVEIAQQSFPNPWTRAMFARELAHGPVSRSYVLRTPEHRVAAFCTCWKIADELHINTVAVRPDCRRRGLARALVQHLLTDMAGAGLRRALLEVRSSNGAAIRLYEGLGFRADGVRRGYYPGDPAEDALILSKDL
jgi:[ribosomal protein S18]-alanine N-acetyltransferase